MMTTSQPSNLNRLRLVPALALRQLLQEKERDHASRYERMSRDRMIEEAGGNQNITAGDIDDLYENYRYGGKVSFYLYLIPENTEVLTIDQIFENLESVDVEDESETNSDADNEQTSVSQVEILDHESIGDLAEIRYKYILKRHFLNENEETDSYLETRYGFVWIDFNDHFMAILAKDEKINRILIEKIAELLEAKPLSVNLPKDLINRYFNLEDLFSASHYSPTDGTRHRISWRGNSSRETNIDVVRQRDQNHVRSSSVYSEPIVGDLVSGLGVAAEKGKIYLLKTLSASALREWGQQRLPELVNGLRDIQSTDSQSFLQTVKSNFQFRGIGQAGKQSALSLMERLISCRQQGNTTVPLNMSVETLLETMPRHFNVYINPYCEQCGNNTEVVCSNCENPSLVPKHQGLVCAECGSTFSYGEAHTFQCVEGHRIRINEVIECLELVPKESLLEVLANEINQIDPRHFDPRFEWFSIRGSTFYYLHQDESVRFQLEDLEGFPTLPVLPDKKSDEYKELRKQVRALKEKCGQTTTIEQCRTCVETDCDACCLMKIFHTCIPEYIPRPHHGNEFGDVNFPTRLFGREVQFKGLIKGYQSGEISPRHSVGRDIITQILTQDASSRGDSALGIITPTRLSGWLETEIERQVRYYQGRVSIIREEQLMRMLLKYQDET